MKGVVRKLQYPGNRDLTEFAGDVAQGFERVIPGELVRFTEVYQEPLFVRTTRPPQAVVALDVREDAAPDESIPVLFTVNFTPVTGGVRINAIEGPSAGTRYRFLLWMVG